MEAKLREKLLRLFKEQKNKRMIEDPDFFAFSGNPNCGDSIAIAGHLDGEGKISDIAFQGDGCVLSKAAASLLTDYVKGMDLEDAAKIPEDKFIKEIIGIEEIGPNRRKCAALALNVLKEAVADYNEKMEELRKQREEDDLFNFDL